MKFVVLLFIMFVINLRVDAQAPATYAQLPLRSVDVRVFEPRVSDTSHRVYSFAHRSAIRKLNENLYHVTVSVSSDQQESPDDISVPINIELGSSAAVNIAKHAFHWVPNIKQQRDDIISQHVFRSPCMIFSLARQSVVVIPDLEMIKENQIAPYYLDLDYGMTDIRLHYGISRYRRSGYDYYKKTSESFAFAGTFNFGFYVMLASSDPTAALKATNHFLWSTYGKGYTRSYLPQTVSFEQYADTGYTMAMQHYWVQTDSNKGAITLSTYFDNAGARDSTQGVWAGRDDKNDLWFHSWFNNARTAFGQYYLGQKLHHPEWCDKSLQTMRLILESPADKGWFPTIYLPEAHRWRPGGQGAGKGNYHLPDNAWTAYWILRYNDEISHLPGADSFFC